ncbi:MAG: glutathione S-transferase C-terminal domain-containing protein, partial [Alteraurantiacibacter sp.]
LHLAETYEKFIPSDKQGRLDAYAWTFWQVGGLGPMIGQWGHFLNAQGDHDYALERYLAETLRLFDVLDKRLANAEYLAGSEYSIADMMCWPWAEGGLGFLDKAAGDRAPAAVNVRRWIGEVSIRPAVIRALDIAERNL